MPSPKGLTDKQKYFVAEYLIDSNAKQAAIRAGYSADSAESIGYELLHKTLVSEAIAAAQVKRSLRTEIDQDWALTRLEKIYDRCMEEEPVLNENGEPIGVYNFAHSGATKSIELILKVQGLLNDKVQLMGADGGAIKIQQEKPIDPETLSTATLEAILADTARGKSSQEATG